MPPQYDHPKKPKVETERITLALPVETTNKLREMAMALDESLTFTITAILNNYVKKI